MTPTLKVVTLPVPKRRVSLSLIRLDATAPAEIIINTTPAREMETSNSEYIIGQAEPNNASGRPKLMKAA